MSIPDDVREALTQWALAYRSAAERDGWRFLMESLGHEEEAPEVVGPELVGRVVEAISMIITLRYLSAVPDAAHGASARAFLARQAYGIPEEERGARYRLRIFGTLHELELYLEELGEVDLEDYAGLFGFDGLEIAAMGRPLEDDEAERLVRAVYEDLTWDGEPWEIHGELDNGVLTLWPRPGEEGEEEGEEE